MRFSCDRKKLVLRIADCGVRRAEVVHCVENSKNSNVRAQRESSQNSRERGKERRRRGGRREGEMSRMIDDENDHGGSPLLLCFGKNLTYTLHKNY